MSNQNNDLFDKQDLKNLSEKLQESTIALNKIEKMLQESFQLIDIALFESKNHISNDKHLELSQKKDDLLDKYYRYIGNNIAKLQAP